jgi:hypothetical protein
LKPIFAKILNDIGPETSSASSLVCAAAWGNKPDSPVGSGSGFDFSPDDL